MNIISSSKQKSYSSLFCSLTIATAISLLKTAEANAFTIDFDYTYDTQGFFDTGTTAGQDRRDTLTQTAQYFTDYISDTLVEVLEFDDMNISDPKAGIGYEFITDLGPPIVTSKNTWRWDFDHPGTGNALSVFDEVIAADTIRIYAGGRDLGTALGVGGKGGFWASGVGEFINPILGRAQSGANPGDQALWGGVISFNNTGINWHNKTTLTGPLNSDENLDTNEYDFLSVAVHEVAHVLGFGGVSWNAKRSGTQFLGTNALNIYNSEDIDGNPNAPNATFVPLANGSEAHWDYNIKSTTLAGVEQETSLDPDIANGQRKLFTNLEYATLEDIGWQVNTAVPFEFSPALGILLMCGFFGVLSIRNRLKGKTRELEIS